MNEWNVNKPPKFHNGERSWKVIQNTYLWQSKVNQFFQLVEPITITNLQQNRLITFAVILPTDKQNKQIPDKSTSWHNIRLRGDNNNNQPLNSHLSRTTQASWHQHSQKHWQNILPTLTVLTFTRLPLNESNSYVILIANSIWKTFLKSRCRCRRVIWVEGNVNEVANR